MIARDIMQVDFVAIREDLPVDEILDLFLLHNIHAAPVIDRKGNLLGILTQQDLLFGKMTLPDDSCRPREAGESGVVKARDIMTSPPVTATEETSIPDLAGVMCRFHVHRLPIVRDGRITGIVSSMDLCRMISKLPDRRNSAIA